MRHILVYAYIITLLSFQLFASEDKVDTASAQLPTLYVFSQKNCQPCIMMNPLIADIKRLYKKKLNVVVFKKRSKERSALYKHFFRRVDLRFTPSFLLVNEALDLLSYGKGYIPKQKFVKIIEDGLSKFEKLNTMKIDELVYICDNTLKFCKSTKVYFDKFLANLKVKPKITEIHMEQYKTREDWDRFFKTMEKFKYLYGWESYPSIIASTKNNEVVHFIQKEFDQQQLIREFGPYLR
ncbi:thioredoxin fold domain-containing protein [bacterium]|nr:thioredoxin fold domain-containing protein [bacterium]